MAKMYLDSSGAATNSGTSDNNSPDLSGSANATVAANTTFTDANVVAATDIVTVASHGYVSGTGVELTTTGTLPAGLTLTTLYFLNALTGSTLTFHTNVADALAGTNPVNITAAAGGGTHTINNHTIALGGSPDLSAVNTAACDVTTTGTSHIITMKGGIHGLATGDAVIPSVPLGGTMPTGSTAGAVVYVNVLSATTFRVYSTEALANAGGASDLNLSANAVRTLYVLTETQAAIALASASNSNRKIFWCKSVDNTNKLFIADVSVTGLGAGSNWAIGGRVNASGATDLMNNFRLGDEAIFNTDISGALNLNFRSGGSSEGPGGWLGPNFSKFTGKTGAVRLLANTGNGTLLSPTTGGSSNIYLFVENMEFQSQGTGAVISFASNCSVNFISSAITDSGALNRFTTNLEAICIRSRFTGGSGFEANNGTFTGIECLFNDLTGDGLAPSGAIKFIGCIFDRCSDRCIENSAASAATARFNLLYANTFYLSGNSGYEETSPQQTRAQLTMINNIFKDCGNASTEANIELLQTKRRLLFERDNLLSIGGTAGGVNALGITLDASDLTSDPLFIDPDNGTASSRNFGLQRGSPAKGIPYTFSGSLSVSYKDLGAVQSAANGPKAITLIGI